MADTIMIKSGALGDRGTMPALSNAELGYITDKEELYIGGGAGNKRLCGVGDISDINAKIDAINAKINDMNNLITSITVRLDTLENPSE